MGVFFSCRLLAIVVFFHISSFVCCARSRPRSLGYTPLVFIEICVHNSGEAEVLFLLGGQGCAGQQAIRALARLDVEV